MSIRVQAASYSLIILCVLGAVGLLAPGPLVAQLQSFESFVSGTVSWDGGGSVNGFQIELNDSAGRQSARADVLPDGRFEIRTFRAVDQHYVLRVRDQSGQVVHDDIVSAQASPLEVHLRAPEQQRPVSGVISAEELLEEIPKKAMREFTRAQKAVQEGEIERAIAHLQKAIRVHPRFVEAHNSLGVKFMLLGDYEHAAAAFEQAVMLRPDSVEPLSNLGMALHGLKKYAESERLIRRALGFQPHAVKTRYALALVLSSQGGKEEEALEILAQVAGQFPEAHIHAARLLGCRADSQGVLREVKAYLASGEQRHRETAERWLRKVQASAPASASVRIE
jgi:tetratricopeptide (TPR) repeat protein